MKLLGTLAALVLTAVAGAGEITLSATGKVSAKPDVAYLSLGVTTKAATAQDAATQNAAAMTTLFAALTKIGVKAEEVQTSEYSISPEYTYPKDSPAVLNGYVASNQVTVTICELTQTGKIIDALVTDGANRVNGLTFGFKDPKKMLDQARTKAAKEATERAKLYADALGVKVVRVKSLSESFDYPRPRNNYDARAATTAGTPIAEGSLTLSVTVTVVFEMTP